MRRADCFIDTRGVGINALLEEWRWLTGPAHFTLLQATAIGDLFLQDASRCVFFLDTIEGKFTQIADSEQDLSEKLNVRANRDRWLSTLFIQLAATGRPPLGPGECWGWKIPLFLGGKAETENTEPSHLLVYHSILGQLFRQATGKR